MAERFQICWEGHGSREGRFYRGFPFGGPRDAAANTVDRLNDDWPGTRHWLEIVMEDEQPKLHGWHPLAK
jgi:hypothetical protein